MVISELVIEWPHYIKLHNTYSKLKIENQNCNVVYQNCSIAYQNMTNEMKTNDWWLEMAVRMNSRSDGHFALVDDMDKYDMIKQLVNSREFVNLKQQDKMKKLAVTMRSYDLISPSIFDEYCVE